MQAGDRSRFDIAIIGAGMAGASVAAELAPNASVLLLEMEAQPGFHTTGRSAAIFAETYGPAPIRALTRASARFFEAPPKGFADNPLLAERGVVMIARADQRTSLETMISEVGADSAVHQLDATETRALIPLLREDYAIGSMHDPSARDIDVHALHHGYLRAFRAAGGTLVTHAEMTGLERTSDGWRVQTASAAYEAGVIVNAAGAWADSVGALAGAAPTGLVPKRRTALMVAAPEGTDPDAWPLAVDVDEQFYLKPDAGRLLISPADETPSPPCDAQPEEIDIAVCVDRIETAFDLNVRQIENKWAGLRSFVADKSPVCGYDGQVESFFWLAGQGGYGIQSAPALARFAASQILRRPPPQDILDHGLDPFSISPARLGDAR